MITNPDGGVDIEDGAFNVEPRPTITSVTLANGRARNNGVIETGDKITVVFSKVMREASVCNAVGRATTRLTHVLNADGDVTVTANDGGAGDDCDRRSRAPPHATGTRPSFGTSSSAAPTT